MENQGNYITGIGFSTGTGTGTGTSTTTFSNMWGTPERVDVIEWQDCIEFIYKETSNITYTIYPAPPPQTRVFKITFSCVDGKWNKSDRIYGEIMPAQEEYYSFP